METFKNFILLFHTGIAGTYEHFIHVIKDELDHSKQNGNLRSFINRTHQVSFEVGQNEMTETIFQTSGRDWLSRLIRFLGNESILFRNHSKISGNRLWIFLSRRIGGGTRIQTITISYFTNGSSLTSIFFNPIRINNRFLHTYSIHMYAT